MSSREVFTSRLSGRPLLDSEGMSIGRVRDVVIPPAAQGDPPRALGLVVTLPRRRIFVNLGRIAEISIDGAHLRGGPVDLDRFTRRTGEILASELYNRVTDAGTVLDVAIAPSGRRAGGWEVSALAMAQSRGLRHRSTTIVPWEGHPGLFEAGAEAEQLAGVPGMHPTDPASPAEALSATPRSPMSAAPEDDTLPDLIAE